MTYLHAVFITAALSIVSAAADYLLKKASLAPDAFRSLHLYAAMLIYAIMPIGWVYVLRHIKLASVGAIYSVIMVVLLALIGVTLFREALSPAEYIGLVCAILALILLGGSGSL